MHSQNPNPKRRRRHLLPEEIIEEILRRLPVKPLLKFRCVSKSWLSLIKSDRFIKIHFQNSRKNTTLAHHIIVFNENSKVMKRCSLPSLMNSKEGLSSSSSVIDPTSNLAKTSILVGCCKGVLCLSNYDGNFFLFWNPATRDSIELPKLKTTFYDFGFGWDDSSGAFKVVASKILYYNGRRSGHVYSSKTNSWKPLPLVSVKADSPFSPLGVFVGGRIHWAMGRFHDDEHVIESFDLENDQFGRMELPPFTNPCTCCPSTWLGEIGGCLCTLLDFKKRKDVWVMKEYGVKDSWFKLHTFPLAIDVPESLLFTPLLGEGLNGEVFIIYGDTLMVYSPKDAFSTSTNKIGCFSGAACIYVDSLVSPQTNTT